MTFKKMKNVSLRDKFAIRNFSTKLLCAKYAKAWVLLFGVFALTACAQQPAGYSYGPGFLLGIFHGLVAPFSFIFSLIADDVRIYSFPNVGVWYDFGHLNSYFRSRAQMTTQRAFNQLHISEFSVEKYSDQHKKMEAESNWFCSDTGMISRSLILSSR